MTILWPLIGVACGLYVYYVLRWYVRTMRWLFGTTDVREYMPLHRKGWFVLQALLIGLIIALPILIVIWFAIIQTR